MQVAGRIIMFAKASEQFFPVLANLFIYTGVANEMYQKALDNDSATVMELSNQT